MKILKKLSFAFILGVMLAVTAVFIPNKAMQANASTQKNVNSLSVSARSYFLSDAATGTVLSAGNENERLPIASMCKIMTLLLCFEEIDSGNLSLDETVFISENASGMGGSQIFLESHAEYLVRDLLKGIVVASANDACVAFAERISGSEENFVIKMNERAAELNMTNTNFVNCTGLPQPGQYSCAKDVAKMFSELIKHSEYFTFSTVWMDKIEHPKGRFTEIANTNKLIRFYNGCDAGKTGYTSEAGHCLCASACRDGLRQIAVVIKEPDSKTRFKDVSNLFNYGFDNFCSKLVVNSNEPLSAKVRVENGKEKEVEVVPETDYSILTKKGEKVALEIAFHPNVVSAPIKKGDTVGELSIYRDGTLCGKINVISCFDVEKAGYIDILSDIIGKMFLIG